MTEKALYVLALCDWPVFTLCVSASLLHKHTRDAPTSDFSLCLEYDFLSQAHGQLLHFLQVLFQMSHSHQVFPGPLYFIALLSFFLSIYHYLACYIFNLSCLLPVIPRKCKSFQDGDLGFIHHCVPSLWSARRVQPVACGSHAAQDGCECSLTQNHKFTYNIMRFCVCVITCRNVFNVWPKKTLLSACYRDAKRLDTPAYHS